MEIIRAIAASLVLCLGVSIWMSPPPKTKGQNLGGFIYFLGGIASLMSVGWWPLILSFGLVHIFCKAIDNRVTQVEPRDAEAQYTLGRRYYRGEGVPKDYKEAAEWFTKAAEQGYAWAQYSLGYMYRDGDGVPQDYTLAYMWFCITAATRDEDPDVNTVRINIDHIAESMTFEQTAKARKLAREWYFKDAEKGDAHAQYCLGNMYRDGSGVLRPNHKTALRWYNKAAEQGHAEARYVIGDMYYHGEGVPQDYSEAVRWYIMAAEQGFVSSKLGYMYREGDGVPQDYTLAYMWFDISAANGQKEMADWRDSTARRMNPEQITRAQRLAREWIEKHRKE